MLAKKVQKKLEEYGFMIYNDFDIVEGEKGDRVFIIEEGVVFAKDSNKSITISFQATTKPEDAANTTLILSELKKPISVMESFLFDDKNNFISGEEAYKLIKKANIQSAKRELTKEQIYEKILSQTNGFEC